jgi:hypothetical protein
MVECLRIRPTAPTKKKSEITEARLTNAIASIVKGDYTTEKLHAQFALTDEQAKRVDEAVKAAMEA